MSTVATMSGLVKPITRRGRSSSSSRNTAINTTRTGQRGGLFISSYEEDKRNKYRKQMKDRLKKWLGVGFILLAISAVAINKQKKNKKDLIERPSLRAPDPEKAIHLTGPKIPPPTMPPTKPPPPPLATITLINTSSSSNNNNNNKSPPQKGSDTSICGRSIPINLSDHSKWPTPFTPILQSNKKPEEVKKDDKKKDAKQQITLLKNDGAYSNIGSQLNEIVHAMDHSIEHDRPLYITQDSWAFTTLFMLFFGSPYTAMDMNDKQLWNVLQDILGIKIVKSAADVEKDETLEVPADNPNSKILFYTVGKSFTPQQIRDHRDTLVRKLFLYPYLNVCESLDVVLGKDRQKKYVVIHTNDGSKNYLSKFNGSYKKDQSGTVNMTPEYIKEILKQSKAEKDHDIYLINGDGDGIDMEVHNRFANDNELKTKIKVVKEASFAQTYYLGTLADVYIGNPVSQATLWVARFRMALGLGKNTFVLMENFMGKGKWESMLSDKNYLDLYDKTKMGGPWMA